MRPYFSLLALCGLAIALGAPSAAATTTASEKAAQASDAATGSSTLATQDTVPAWLVGAWVLVRCDNIYPDGHRIELYGPHPQGFWMIDAQGHYMMHIVRAERAPFAANDKSKGTPEEYRAASLDSNAHFGTVSVKGDSMQTHIDHASYPNWDGKGGATTYSLQGDELTYTVAKPSSGAAEGARGIVVWRRLHS